MLLNYKMTNVLTLYIPGKGTALTPFQLLPGINEIEDAVWKTLKKQKGVAKLIAKGNLLEKAAPAKDNKKAGKGLAKYGADEATYIVEETFDKVLLGSWLKIETRSVVKTAIEAQLVKVEESLTKKDEDEENE